MEQTARTTGVTRHSLRFAAPLLVLLCASVGGIFVAPTVFAAKAPPPQRIDLTALGYEGISTRYLLSGASMLTLDYVDNQHLLVTFGVPRLMKRLPGDPPTDEDRVVDAVLLELPTGREVARTEWRFHDIGQYLWDLGGGRFLLRQRATLTTFAPLAQLASGKPFEQHPLLHFDRRVDTILVSADRQLLTVETSDPNAPEEELATAPPPPILVQNQPQPVANTPGLMGRPATSIALPAQTAVPVVAEHTSSPVQISFMRLIATSSPETPLVASFAGSLNLSKDVSIPMTSEGYLRTRDQSSFGVKLEFATFGGKVTDLGPFETSCPPNPDFVSPSEFIAFGCRGSDDHLTLAGFNLRGDLMWQANFNDIQAFPSMVSAIPAGRFALSRTVTSSHVFPNEIPSSAQIDFQEVRVFQMYSGKQLLRVFTTPEQRAGQNFALSPDGLSLAVIHDPVDPRAPVDMREPSIEIYRLPPLTAADKQQIKAESALAPPQSAERVQFTSGEVRSVKANAKSGDSMTSQSSSQAGLMPESTIMSHNASSSDPSAPQTLRPIYGDIPPPPNRKAPTLYDLPGETPPNSEATPRDPEAAAPSSSESPSASPSTPASADPKHPMGKLVQTQPAQQQPN